MDGCSMRVRKTIEVQVDDLPERLAQANNESRKTLAQICREAGITPTYWYSLVRGKKDSIPHTTLKNLEFALGVDLGVKFE